MDGGRRVSRIRPIRPAEADGVVARVLQAQTDTWGAPLTNHLVYARRPTLFRAFRAVWSGLNADSILDDALVAIVNRRIAWLNGCVF